MWEWTCKSHKIPEELWDYEQLQREGSRRKGQEGHNSPVKLRETAGLLVQGLGRTVRMKKDSRSPKNMGGDTSASKHTREVSDGQQSLPWTQEHDCTEQRGNLTICQWWMGC